MAMPDDEHEEDERPASQEGEEREYDRAGHARSLMRQLPCVSQFAPGTFKLSHYPSAAFGRPSGEMAARADQPTPRGIAATEGGHMIIGQGAVPIIRNGVIEGACGVGGGTSQEDEDCARTGVAQL